MKRSLRITISYAQSLDGRIATVRGDSQWISCPRTLRLAQRLRRDNQVILVGIGTVLRDDPRLSCRLPGSRSPLRVILDSMLRLPEDCQIVRTCGTYDTMLYTTERSDAGKRARLERSGLRLRVLEQDREGRVPIPAVVEDLQRQGYRSLFVEGGAAVITSFLRAGLVDRMLVVVAPLLIGRGIEALGDLGVQSLEQALRPRRQAVRRLGSDMVWELTFNEP